MSSSSPRTSKALRILSTVKEIDAIIRDIREKEKNTGGAKRLPGEVITTPEGIAARISFLKQQCGCDLPYLTGTKKFTDYEQLQGSIENYIGMTTVPTGVVGPVRVIGSAAKGDYYIPLATSEGALVASYHRGAKALCMAGGATSICLIEGVQRSPLFRFPSIAELGEFIVWVLRQIDKFREITEQNSRFAKLLDMKSNIEGNHLILTFEFHTGDAAGQNMVTLSTDAICRYILENCPTKPVFWFVESNYSGDKKATSLSFTNVRGRKVTTEVNLSEKIVRDVLKSSPAAMCDYWRSSTIGIIQSGAIGAHGQYANGLAALFIATGQDAACVSEAAIGITRMEMTPDGGLYASVTLPNLIVGTVGGGTSLPSQRECLELMDCYGPGNARKFAEICGAVTLCGELSIAAALAEGHFSAAHQKLGRKKSKGH